jgi:hypothetical protein
MMDTQKLYNQIYNQLKKLNLKYEDLLHRKKSKSEALEIFSKTMLGISNKTIDNLQNEIKRLEYQLNHINLHPELYSDDSSVIENTKYNLELAKNELKKAKQEKVKLDYLIIETSITIDALNKLMQEYEYKEHIPNEIILLKDEIINKTIPIINEATNRLVDKSNTIIKNKDTELKEVEAKYTGVNREHNILIDKYKKLKNNKIEWIEELLPKTRNNKLKRIPTKYKGGNRELEYLMQRQKKIKKMKIKAMENKDKKKLGNIELLEKELLKKYGEIRTIEELRKDYIKSLLKEKKKSEKEENIKHDKELITTELKNNKGEYLFKNGKINCEKLHKAIGYKLLTGKSVRHLRNFIKKYLKKN